MKRIWALLGKVGGYLSWPAVFVVIRFTRRARVLVVCDQEILVIRPWLGTGSWQCPGGGVKASESFAQAAQRELAEELGLAVTATSLIDLGSFRQRHGFHYTFQGFVLVATQKLDSKPNVHEVTATRWVTPMQLHHLPAQEHVRLLLEAWQKQA